MSSPMRIDVWSDVACPWCYVGKRHLEKALQAAEQPFEVVWHAYELNPGAEVSPDPQPYQERLARKYQCSEDEAQAMIDRMVGAGAQAGLELRFDRIRPTNTFDAHRLIAWARSQDKQTEMKERLLQAYMTEGRDLGDRAVLAELAGEVGFEPSAATAMLEAEDFTREVRGDEAVAARIGVQGVPFFLMAGKLGLSGAQPPEVIQDALRKAAEMSQAPESS